MTRRIYFKLVRTLPNGTEKTQGGFTSKREAAVAASHVLYDNSACDKGEAQRFSAQLEREELEFTRVHGASGYKFRIEQDD